MIDIFSNDEKSKKSSDLQNPLPWRDILAGAIAPDVDQVSSLRAWASFSQVLQKSSPETQWIFIREEDKNTDDTEFLDLSLKWIHNLLAHPSWPFPKKIVCSIESQGKNRTLRLALSDLDGVIPYVNPPRALGLTPWKKKPAQGWKVMKTDSQYLKKTGHA